MSVEKIPGTAAQGAGNAKSGGGIKGGHGVQGAGDAFGALLTSLGIDDFEPAVARSAFPEIPDDHLRGDAGSDGGAVVAFQPIVLSMPFAVASVSVPFGLVGGFQNELLSAGEIPSADGAGSITLSSLSNSFLSGNKQGSRSSGPIDLSQVSDAAGPFNAGTKVARLLKDRGRSESATAVLTEPKTSVNAIDLSKLNVRTMSEKVEFRGAALVLKTEDLLPLGVGQQTEFQREKAIFKIDSFTAGADASAPNGLEPRPTGLNLESLATDVGAGMALREQDSGAYWMSSDLKKAEMKLDGFGESSVDVSVSVHGNQTHVVFRTDDVQTRVAMEDANVTLKDMLSKEGLDLAGVSVGTSGAGGEGAPNRRSRQDSSPVLIGKVGDKFQSGAPGQAVSGGAGQLDVFV